MLWTETAGETLRSRTATENSRITTQVYPDPAISTGRFGQNVHSQIRRFVIVKVNRRQHFVLAW
jgi:di/tripeptidase